jgi:hypothetical protein
VDGFELVGHCRPTPRGGTSRSSSSPLSISPPKTADAGTQLIQELIADGCHAVRRCQPTTDKIMCLNAQNGVIENGFVHIPETAPWLAEYLHEMTVFPSGKHDDQVDSTAQFLDWSNKPFPSQGYYEWVRQRAQAIEEQRKPQPVKTVWARGSMEWQAEQEKAG